MSWDEKDWSNTTITGIPERYGVSKISEKVNNSEISHEIFLRDFNIPDLGNAIELEKIAKLFGVMIEYRYLGGYKYCYDFRAFAPQLNKEEINQRDLIKEVYDIVSNKDY